jgi:hypothetical protein
MIYRSVEQRQEALVVARELRSVRSDFRKATKKGAPHVALVFAALHSDPVFSGMRVKYYIESWPTVGKTKAANIMKKLGISPCKRLGGLSNRQLAALYAISLIKEVK